MPDARTHDVITVVSGAALSPLAYSALLANGIATEVATVNTAVFFVAHVLSGTMFSPDLDIDSAIDDRWGVFYWIWRPYMWLVPHRHRFLSHGLVISALLRLVYFYAVVVVLLFLVTWIFGQLGIVVPDFHWRFTNRLITIYNTYPLASRVFIGGFVTGGAAHTIADWLVTGGKRYLRRMGVQVRRDYRGHDRWLPRASRRRGWGR